MSSHNNIMQDGPQMREPLLPQSNISMNASLRNRSTLSDQMLRIKPI